MIQPIRHPVTLKVFDAPLMVTVRSRMPGSVAIGMCSPVVEDVLVDLVGHRERVVRHAEIADRLQLARVNTRPEGLLGGVYDDRAGRGE